MDNENKNYVDYIKEALDSKPKMSDLADRIIDMNDSEYWEIVRKIAEDMKLKYKQWQIENKKKEIEKDFE
jgi:hypothetical protein